MPSLSIAALIFIFSLGVALIVSAEGAFRHYQWSLKRRLALVLRGFKTNYTEPETLLDRALHRWLRTITTTPAWRPQISERQIFILGVLLAGGVGVLLRLLDISVWVATVGGVVALPFAQRFFAQRDQVRQSRRFQEEFPETLDMFVRMLRAGLPVQHCLARICAETSDGTSDVYREVKSWLDMGLPLDKAFLRVNERIKIDEFEFLGTALSIQSTAGGNLAQTLESLAQIIRARLLQVLKVRALTGEARMTAYIVMSLPAIVFVGLRILVPDYLDPILDGTNGYGLLSFIVISYFLGLLVVRSMMSAIEKV